MNLSPQAAQSAKPTAKKKALVHSYPFWCPRFWHGMLLGDWWKLLVANRFRVHPLRMPMAAGIFSVSSFNSVMARLQRSRYGRQIAATKLEHPPVFIIGHWRSGTTYLHELMVLDERFTSPTTYKCFVPHHFLLTEWLIARYMGFLVPKQRPMDNVAAGWDRPQEDEFALLTLGAPTPYRRMAFPNHPAPDEEFLDMHQVDPQRLELWGQALVNFAKALAFQDSRRLVLKSPPHTGRVESLSRLFPGAKFVHIVRHPYSVFPSTKRLWQSLDAVQALQLPKHRDLDEYIFRTFTKMYDGFNRQRPSLHDNQICDVHYEKLVEDPVGEMARIYETLELGDFSDIRKRLEEQRKAEYRTNQYNLDPQLKQKIHQRWRGFFEQYGYDA